LLKQFAGSLQLEEDRKNGCFHGACFPKMPLNWPQEPNICHMQLLSDEEILVSSNENRVVLTNLRIQRSTKDWGRSHQITIFLENISSIEMLYRSNPLLLVLTGFFFLVGLMTSSAGYENDATLRFGGFILSIIFLGLWFYSKSRLVTIASNRGSKLNFRVDGMKTPDVLEFIDKVMQAKAARARYLFGV
jgi:hypothetical protein